jgi:hypothetical protein
MELSLADGREYSRAKYPEAAKKTADLGKRANPSGAEASLIGTDYAALKRRSSTAVHAFNNFCCALFLKRHRS